MKIIEILNLHVKVDTHLPIIKKQSNLAEIQLNN